MSLTTHMLKLADEMHAASEYIRRHGKIEIGTPQDMRLAAVVNEGRKFGIEPQVPADYPMVARQPDALDAIDEAFNTERKSAL